jgi:hypothetical protein
VGGWGVAWLGEKGTHRHRLTTASLSRLQCQPSAALIFLSVLNILTPPNFNPIDTANKLQLHQPWRKKGKILLEAFYDFFQERTEERERRANTLRAAKGDVTWALPAVKGSNCPFHFFSSFQLLLLFFWLFFSP